MDLGMDGSQSQGGEHARTEAWNIRPIPIALIARQQIQKTGSCGYIFSHVFPERLPKLPLFKQGLIQPKFDSHTIQHCLRHGGAKINVCKTFRPIGGSRWDAFRHRALQIGQGSRPEKFFQHQARSTTNKIALIASRKSSRGFKYQLPIRVRFSQSY